MNLTVPSLDQLPATIPALLQAIGPRRKIALYGEMGAGKTTLVKAICRQLGVQGATASPTFSLINEYTYRDEHGQPALLHHLDLYRLRNAEEALDIGIQDILDDPWLCFIEWPQLVESLLPPDAVKIQIEVIGETARGLLIL